MEDTQDNDQHNSIEYLKQQANLLLDCLDAQDKEGAQAIIQTLNRNNENSIYKEVGRLTRGLHDAMRNFDIDVQQSSGAAGDDSSSEMSNARDRLTYVVNLTQDAADKTMDMVEQGIPISSALSEQAVVLREDWSRLMRREMTFAEFKEFYKQIDAFLGETSESASAINQKFNEILMAQGFQDLTGQVISKVTALVKEVEDRLVELVRVAGQVEQIAGISEPVEESKPKDKQSGRDIEAEGPQIHADKRSDVVSGQDDVDELLSSLGF